MVIGKDPNVVGIEVLKKNGIDVDKLIKELVTNASVEFTAYYYFTLLRANCTGMEGEGIKGVIEDARLEDLSHFESCIERIYQLGGSLPKDATDFIKMSGCEFLQLPPNPTDIKAILEKCLKAEQGAIVNWDRVCQMTSGKDPVTFDIAKDILAEEIEENILEKDHTHKNILEHLVRYRINTTIIFLKIQQFAFRDFSHLCLGKYF